MYRSGGGGGLLQNCRSKSHNCPLKTQLWANHTISKQKGHCQFPGSRIQPKKKERNAPVTPTQSNIHEGRATGLKQDGDGGIMVTPHAPCAMTSNDSLLDHRVVARQC